MGRDKDEGFEFLRVGRATVGCLSCEMDPGLDLELWAWYSGSGIWSTGPGPWIQGPGPGVLDLLICWLHEEAWVWSFRSGNLFPKAWISRVWELVTWTYRLGSGILSLWSWAQVGLDLDFWIW